MQQCVLAQIRWFAQWWPARDEPRAAHGEQLLRAQARNVEPRPAAFTAADSEVYVLTREIDM
jgi:hypothetical protein